MDLIIGGAYQGKLAYARQTFALDDADIGICTADAAPDWQKRCLTHYEQYILYCLRRNITPQTPPRPDAVILATDIFCGVVPVDAETRAWREACGRALTGLSQQAASVTRLFCGLPQKLK